uniref:SURP motif domain-containing protein n=1 Tax=Chromera velia CCMP2878 TaxID=1169474 RepID=A0A0G4F3Q9_9ALVE|mmetsp:Transcript_47472/g.93589  ORF Transcript_47472/g.93589 Transcript_47472/m.93589 type:complete len:682 (-) Transcript_47472:487-2532(-)|eukprot:Cvel_14969.t1-p1 / transcript=Cvel_14969.t1 / gene=Cvel_14969 / organism=Chromera_velia_CCMP2878 / gene_product=Splicing factor 3A subunit 1, putative / transcript_product=Splicing factor 3A subunit 1, putative / location=Cvel_scaffold1087:25731-31568(+) / protein_length=681 / sequence_SO=supercontig / SO=protein_coding / is_pseudo=false
MLGFPPPPQAPMPPARPAAPPTASKFGIIFPPPDIQNVIEKTASFVAKNGDAFESRIIQERQGDQQKFGFLMKNNPYRPYYEMKLRELRGEDVGDAKRPTVPRAILDQQAKEAEKKARKEQLKMLTMGGETGAAGKKELKPPPEDVFSVQQPYIAPLDLDVIKLTAQFVARNGQKFLMALTEREEGNGQFSFLKPTHHLFGYFSKLIEAYHRCLVPSDDTKKFLKSLTEDGGDGGEPKENGTAKANGGLMPQDIGAPLPKLPQQFLDRATDRFEWEANEAKKRKEKEEAEEEERVQMMQIDWHDFVIVDTIEFTLEDEHGDLGAPIDFSAGRRQAVPPSLEAQGRGAVIQRGRVAAAGREEEDMEMEMEMEEDVQVMDVDDDTAPPGQQPQKPGAAADEDMDAAMDTEGAEGAAAPAAAAAAAAAAASAPGAPADRPRDDTIDLPAGVMNMDAVKIRHDYKRRPVGAKRKAAAGMQICPITGREVRAEEMTEHLRILLLDPKWKEQKDRLLEKAKKESAFAGGSAVENNLAAFVAHRPDLFGSIDDQMFEEDIPAGAPESAQAPPALPGAAAPPMFMPPPQQTQQMPLLGHAPLPPGPPPAMGALPVAGAPGTLPVLPSGLPAPPPILPYPPAPGMPAGIPLPPPPGLIEGAEASQPAAKKPRTGAEQPDDQQPPPQPPPQ